MKALVKPSTEPYANIIPETSWGDWIRSNINTYMELGWTLITDYEPPEPEPMLT